MPDASSLIKPNLGSVHHYGYVVDSIEQTVDRLVAQFGAGPFFKIDGVPLEHVTSGDGPAEFHHNSAFGYVGEDPVELMEISTTSPRTVTDRFAGPVPRLHHVAWLIEPSAVAGVREVLDQQGIPAYLHAHLGDIDFTYHDGSSTLGHDIEIHADVDQLQGFFTMFRQAADGWDGSDPLRPAMG